MREQVVSSYSFLELLYLLTAKCKLVHLCTSGSYVTSKSVQKAHLVWNIFVFCSDRANVRSDLKEEEAVPHSEEENCTILV